ncbi:MAG TPA: hypothetical protein VFB01_06830 [Burkholderiales bacterium]|nr:hypothetical protein [Burkholderiales bacterium]
MDEPKRKTLGGLRDAEERQAAFRQLVGDLSLIRKALEKRPA